MWALEGGNGQLVNIDLFVEEEFHQQFKELYEEHFKTQSDAELSKFGIRQAMSVTALLVLALVVIIVIDICFTSRLAYYFEVPSFFIYQAYVLLAFIGVTVSYLDRIYRLLLRRKDV